MSLFTPHETIEGFSTSWFLVLGSCVWVISRPARAGFQQQTRRVNYKEVIKESLQTYYSQFYSDSVMAPFGGDATVKIAGYWFGKKPNMSWPVIKMEPMDLHLFQCKSIHFLSLLILHSGSPRGWSLSLLSWGESDVYPLDESPAFHRTDEGISEVLLHPCSHFLGQ